MGGLLQLLEARAEDARPLGVGVIGAGKFATMFLSQARRLSGLHVLGVADLAPERAREALNRAGWPAEQYGAASLAEAATGGSTCVTDDADALIRADGVEVVVEATGDPAAGIHYALQCFEYRRHAVMVNVEADAVAGPLLAARAAAAGVVYSLAYGDQPALICEQVEWARSKGFEVVCAGKGTKYLPVYHTSTPDDVWGYYGLSREAVERNKLNPQMFNSFLDGTKSAIEMAAVANATGLRPQPEGLRFPPCGVDHLHTVCRPRRDGGELAHSGTVEVVSCLERDGSPVERDLRWGVYVTIVAPSEYVANCFAEYGLATDPTGRYAAMYRPYHLIGLELATSVLRVGLRGEATGCPTGFRADVAATAKRDLAPGEMLDGEGGYCVYGTLMPAGESLRVQALPLGLANRMKVRNPVAAGQILRWQDVACDESDPAVRFRREMEQGASTPKR